MKAEKVYLKELLDELDQRDFSQRIKRSKNLIDTDHIEISVRNNTAFISTAGYTNDEIMDILSAIMETLND